MLKKFLKFFTKKSIIKIFIIFIVGFVIRIIVNYVYNINVFIDYINIVSIVYYYFMASFVVVINEIITQFPHSSLFNYGSNKICLGSDIYFKPVKNNCIKSNIDTPIHLFHNGDGSKANKNVSKSYGSNSLYVRSNKGFYSQTNSKDIHLNKFIQNDSSKINNTETDLLSEGSRSFIISSFDNNNDNILISPKTERKIGIM